MSKEQKDRGCSFCGGSKRSPLYEKEGFRVVQCTQCHLGYVENPPPLGVLLSDCYGRQYFEGGCEGPFQSYLREKDLRIESGRGRVKEIREYVDGGRLLDVGCATGFFLEAAKPYFEVSGVEPSTFASRHAREELGLPVVTGDLFEARFPDASFDVITMWDVLEHVSDPMAYLREARRILKPRGHLALSTGDAGSFNAKFSRERWGLVSPPWHLYYIPRRLLVRMLGKTGYHVVRLKTNGYLVAVDTPFIQNPVVSFLVARLKLGDIVTVVARTTQG